jgi:hypothetical protein
MTVPPTTTSPPRPESSDRTEPRELAAIDATSDRTSGPGTATTVLLVATVAGIIAATLFLRRQRPG